MENRHMKILLAPSEAKCAGGEYTFDPSSLLFETLRPQRIKLLHTYTNIIQQNDFAVLSKMFGLKKEAEISKYKVDIIHELTMKAILRYTGVAFEYLKYTTLTENEQQYIDTNVIVFSNLFGAIRASDLIPEYKLKQGEAVGDIKPEKLYKKYSQSVLDEYLKDEEILDLRAGFYDKFYKPTQPYTTVKFIKNGKVVSHWAKAYRGIVLREIAKAHVQTLDDFIKLPIKDLILDEVKTQKNKTEIIYSIQENT